MNLDDQVSIFSNDPDRVIESIIQFSTHIQTARLSALQFPLPEIVNIASITIAGVGASACAGELSLALFDATIPVYVCKDYSLPDWIHGESHLVIGLSYFGESEEVLSITRKAVERQCTVLVMTAGGQLADFAARNSILQWLIRIETYFPIGVEIAMLVTLFERLGLLQIPQSVWDEMQSILLSQTIRLCVDSIVAENPAKRLAGQMMGRSVILYASGWGVGLVSAWKSFLNKMAKTMACVESLPDADHTSIVGTSFPHGIGERTLALFFHTREDHIRNRLRAEKTRTKFLLDGFATDFYQPDGTHPLIEIASGLHFGLWTAYYLSSAYGIDPYPLECVTDFKHSLSSHSQVD